MAKVIVSKIVKERKNKSGRDIYNVMGTIDGEPDVFDMWNQPELGKVYEGTIKDSDYGKTFSVAGRSGGGGGRQYGKSEEERGEIKRQNALTNAVNFAIARATFMDKKEALDYLSGKTIVMVATGFTQFTNGQIKMGSVISQPAPKAEPTLAQQAQETFPDAEEYHDPGPEGTTKPVNEDVNPEEIPF